MEKKEKERTIRIADAKMHRWEEHDRIKVVLTAILASDVFHGRDEGLLRCASTRRRIERMALGAFRTGEV